MYKGIFKEIGINVSEENAFNYAMHRILKGTEEDKAEFVEWFYSGNWIKENNEEEL